MASSLIAKSLQVNFDSVLGIPDNKGMVMMFRALVSTRLSGFIGCPSVLYEQDLEHFFDTAFVKDNEIQGKFVGVSEDLFAGVFELPTTGLTDVDDVPKNLVYDARSIFSKSGEPVQTSCKKRTMKNEFRLLNDILAKSVTVKAGSFDAVTHERFLLMTAIHFGLKINWSKILFDILKGMFLNEPLRSGEDDDMSGLKQPSKIIQMEKESEKDKDIDPVTTEDLSLAKIVATMTDSEDTEPLSKVLKLTDKSKSDEESMSIKDILKQIPEGMMLPSLTAAEITRIKFGLGIEIPEVNEGDWYKASLPLIATLDNGKAPLVAKDEIKGHPARDMFSLICADIDFLVQLREKYTTLRDNLAELIALFNRGRDDKKGEEVAAEVHSLPLMIVADLVLEMKVADLVEAVGANLRVKVITKVVDLTEDQEEALDTG
ncbi:hypothetical protein F511_30828 [Dorcoceras hygrometricum]|uniref:Splicing factor 3B subunit 1-like n=1 Tax=Dorcoceras hygrometricum TaxID=472368 RepID=A0A2Z7BLJ7_9LAMI|nr:hypothetical protein F511_30828 [Dorcoceras hygrometricum]